MIDFWSSWASSWLPLGSSWGFRVPSWERLGSPWKHLGSIFGRPGSVLGDPGAILEASKRRLRGSLGHLRAVLRALEAMLEPSGCQKAPKMEPKQVPNRVPEATRAEYGKTLIFNDSTQDFNDFQGPRGSFWVPNGVQNRVQNGISTQRPLESIVEASWKALGAL